MKLEQVIIEKGVEMPVGPTRTPKWDSFFEKMEIGDSFVCDVGDRQTYVTQACGYRKRKNIAFKLKSKSFSEREIRVWRVE